MCCKCLTLFTLQKGLSCVHSIERFDMLMKIYARMYMYGGRDTAVVVRDMERGLDQELSWRCV